MRPKYLLSILFALFLVLGSSISVSAEESDIVSDSTQQFNSIFTSEEYLWYVNTKLDNFLKVCPFVFGRTLIV